MEMEKKAENDFLQIWMEFEARRRKREQEIPILQGEDVEELVRERAPYLNDLIHALWENSEVILEITQVLEEARCFCTGERELYPFMVIMHEIIEQTPSFAPTFYPIVRQAKVLLLHNGDATLLRCVKQTMDAEKEAIELGDKALDYIGLFEQLVEEGDEQSLREFAGATCRLYFELKDMHDALLHDIKKYQQLNRVYRNKTIIDYNRHS